MLVTVLSVRLLAFSKSIREFLQKSTEIRNLISGGSCVILNFGGFFVSPTKLLLDKLQYGISYFNTIDLKYQLLIIGLSVFAIGVLSLKGLTRESSRGSTSTKN